MPRIGAALNVVQVPDPATPSAGRQFLYFKSDGLLYSKNSAGVVAQVGALATATTTVIDGGATPDEVYSGVITSSNPGATPANMVTTDTTQTISGTKSFIANVGLPSAALSNSSSILTFESGTAKGTWINLGGVGDLSGIGDSGAGANAWIAKAAGNTNWLVDSLAGDICYRSALGSSLRFGVSNVTNTQSSVMRIFADTAQVTGTLVLGGSPLTFNGGGGNLTVRMNGLNNAPFTIDRGADNWPGILINGGGAPIGPHLAVRGQAANTISDLYQGQDSAGVSVFRVSAAGGVTSTSGVSSVKFDLTQDWTTTNPVTPTTGVTLFSRHKARRLLSVVGPSGLDTTLQPAIFSNKIALVSAIQGSAIESVVGTAVSRTTAPVAGPALAATNFYSRMSKLRYNTVATVGGGNGPRTSGAAASLSYFLSNVVNLGGFFFVARFGVAVSQTGSRGFVGLSSAVVQYPAAAEPSAGVNQIGFGWDATHTTLWMMQNGTTAAPANHVNLGALFPTKTSAVDFYECRLFVPSGNGASVSWSVTRLNTGDFAQGVVTAGLPGLDVYMAAHVGLSNGTTAAVASLDLQSLYVETDN